MYLDIVKPIHEAARCDAGVWLVWEHIFEPFKNQGLLGSRNLDEYLSLLDEEPWKGVAEQEGYLYHLHTVITFRGLCGKMPDGLHSPAGPFNQPIPNCPTSHDFLPKTLHRLPSVIYSYFRSVEPSWFILDQIKKIHNLEKALLRHSPQWINRRAEAWEDAGAKIIRSPLHPEQRGKRQKLFPSLDKVVWGDRELMVKEQLLLDIADFKAEVETLLRRVPDRSRWSSPLTEELRVKLFYRNQKVNSIYRSIDSSFKDSASDYRTINKILRLPADDFLRFEDTMQPLVDKRNELTGKSARLFREWRSSLDEGRTIERQMYELFSQMAEVAIGTE